MNQMLLVLLALALFSTLMLNTFNVLLNQSTMVYDKAFFLQGQKIADRYFQRIEAQMVGNPPVFGFNDINEIYSDFSESIEINGINYNVEIDAIYCDSLGNVPYADTLYQRVDVRINCLSSSKDTLYIGTAASPISEIYYNMRL